MLEKRCGDEIVWRHFPFAVNMEPEEDDGNNGIHVVGQLAEKMGVPIFPWVEWFLPSFAIFEGRLQIFFVVNHFRVIGLFRDVRPPLFDQIYRIPISINYTPTYISLEFRHCLFKKILSCANNGQACSGKSTLLKLDSTPSQIGQIFPTHWAAVRF